MRRPPAEREGPAPQASGDRTNRRTHNCENTSSQPRTQATADIDDARGEVLILNVAGRRLIRWFATRALVEHYLATARDDDDIFGISTVLFELEVSIHDTHDDARRAAAAAKEKLARVYAPGGRTT